MLTDLIVWLLVTECLLLPKDMMTFISVLLMIFLPSVQPYTGM